MKNNLSIHAFEHAPCEGVGCIGNWAKERGHRLSSTLLYKSQRFPRLDEIDWLIVMGGPMNIFEEQKHPWLKAEKAFIKNAIEANKTVIGICLGSQLIADVLGAKVYKNPQVEIGWFDVTRTEESYQTDLLKGFGRKLKVFHWHGDTFDLPPGVIPLFRSKACQNQGFLIGNKIVGLQFHFEMTQQGIAEMFTGEEEPLPKGPFVQTQQEIVSQNEHIEANNKKMFALLDRLCRNSEG
ncbi:GMP synthase (glutamine-hydrolysing) [Mariniphaga anaerophila]|uniref:GMP synthase (Glutamine-hydrolysing) n=1 Tax=Mariniphaga anaerophila TaxID=1484053 RepID=A0A1M4XPP6_9BACT|nr:type 1 glutamine amidotransferase [Mariniphaga anaerophila]SHE95243.1 GMP synthase (glutamine-hydrolysing) [Mariniphaga anaerophila]